MTTHTLIAREPHLVKTAILEQLNVGLDRLLETVDDVGPGKRLKLAVWNLVLEVGRDVPTALLALLCWRVAEREAPADARFRLDKDYRISRTTTFGPIEVPLFAWREGRVTHCPSRAEVFPLHPGCRSSVLCLEWEARLGSGCPSGKRNRR